MLRDRAGASRRAIRRSAWLASDAGESHALGVARQFWAARIRPCRACAWTSAYRHDRAVMQTRPWSRLPAIDAAARCLRGRAWPSPWHGVRGLSRSSLRSRRRAARARCASSTRSPRRLEVRMWQAYYAKERARLFGCSSPCCASNITIRGRPPRVEGFHLARAAATFRRPARHYEVVLPDLEAAYTQGAIVDRRRRSIRARSRGPSSRGG